MDLLVSWDWETHLMKAGALAPKAVAGSLAFRDPQTAIVHRSLGVSGDAGTLEYVRDTVLSKNHRKVAHNASFDLGVICANWPEYIPRVFEMIANGEVSCTIIREKLLNLVDSGSLEWMQLHGQNIKIEYNLAGMARFYLGRDRTEEKNDPTAWRLNYHLLDGVPSSEWPQDAKDYSIADAVDVLEIYELQEQKRAQVWQRSGFDPFVTEAFMVSVDLALFLVSCWGMVTDPHRKAQIEQELAVELSPEKLSLLYEYGVVRSALPPRPYANGATNKDGTPKMTLGKAESVNTVKLKAYMRQFCEQHAHVKLWRTPRSETHPEGDVSTRAEWFDEFASLDPVLEQYQARQKLQKMVTTEMPRLCTKDEKGNSTGITSPIVHPCFNVLVETGRTSSFATETYPSLNGQNVDPRARPCIVAREGTFLFSVDYSQMELGTLAQRCYELFGYSILRDTINSGVDVHEYTGAQLAYHLSPEFQQHVHNITQAQSQQEVWQAFHALKDVEASAGFYKHFRTFAKPTNLGYPGGLGPDTFIAYAKGSYGVTVDLQLAQRLRELWMQTYPEMNDYFRWIKENCVDHRNGPKIKIDDQGRERKQDLYAYTTPFGLHRAGASFCATANGTGLQSPAAEGAKLGLFNVVRACFDPTLGSILGDDAYGPTTRIVNFIHDELLGEVRADAHAHDRVMEVGRIMVEAMKIITPDVTPRAEACMMRRWYKQAEPAFDANGRLIPWEPTEN